MLEKINLEEIFDSYSETDCDYCYTKESILFSMKMACQKLLELAAENAKMKLLIDEENDIIEEATIDKQSILDTIKQVE